MKSIAELDAAVLLARGNCYMADLVRILQPKYVVELGTGAGTTAAQIMTVLPVGSRFVTINWPNPPSGDSVGVKLRPWTEDRRLTQILGDTRDPHVVAQIIDGVDLLFIDSGTTHEYALISVEWELYRPKLANNAIVMVDDIHFPGSDMERFWDPLPYDKVETCNGQMGMFRYEIHK